jgi:hypothetical protein
MVLSRLSAQSLTNTWRQTAIVLAALASLQGCAQASNEPRRASNEPLLEGARSAAGLSDPAKNERRQAVEEPATIGAATMAADGTLQITLRAADGSGLVGEAHIEVAPGNENHAMWIRHLGGMEPGQSKLVPPFPPE